MSITRTVRALAVTTIVGLLTLGAAAPAQAHTNVCIGTGTFRTGHPMFFVGFGGPTTTSFTMAFPVTGHCTAFPVPESFAGTVAGNCGLATGAGTSATGHQFTFVWQGGTLTFQGQVQGELAINEDPGNDCTTGATRFRVSGGLLLSHT
ncbi:MAG TPA: hypothetical protein VNQ77_00230 [Frankiaceae bacterium]|nr:hypothetical protein [Frankiaceae bacterium]